MVKWLYVQEPDKKPCRPCLFICLLSLQEDMRHLQRQMGEKDKVINELKRQLRLTVSSILWLVLSVYFCFVCVFVCVVFCFVCFVCVFVCVVVIAIVIDIGNM